MKAIEAAKLNDEAESEDNSASVLSRVQHAARQRKRSIRVEADTMTSQTRKRLRKLGYLIVRVTEPRPSRESWIATAVVYVVSW